MNIAQDGCPLRVSGDAASQSTGEGGKQSFLWQLSRVLDQRLIVVVLRRQANSFLTTPYADSTLFAT